uniref:HVA22-like protein n=1 Tax=Kalanchoe fedtschenkoi TaxID=63787 RepID=A0A7N0UZU8_KALFE
MKVSPSSARLHHITAEASADTIMGSKTGVGAEELAKVLVKNIDVIAGPLISLAYPLYASIREIENKSPDADDRQWLTYWIMYSMITLFELTFATFLDWVPVWPYVKLIAFVWLVMPQFRGAAYLYESFVRPLYVNPHSVHTWYVPKKKDRIGKREDIIAAASKYIHEHGSQDRGLAHTAEIDEQYRNLNYIDPDPIYGSSKEVYREEPSYRRSSYVYSDDTGPSYRSNSYIFDGDETGTSHYIFHGDSHVY